ncbi:MAG: TadG family pilus assembly protein [Pseudomonadota bacterium]
MKSMPLISTQTQNLRQRGSILVQASAFLLVIVIALSGTELGYLFYVKREMQKAVDLSALAGAQALNLSGCTAGAAAATANANKNLERIGFIPTVTAICGTWTATSTAPQHFVVGGTQPNAMKVSISGTGPTLIPLFQFSRLVTTQAVAAGNTALAALTIRSTLASVDTSKSAALNSLFGGLLDGSVNLSAVGWDGLVKTDIKLLSYLDQLAINSSIAAGQYDQVVAAPTSVGNLLHAAVQVLQRDGGTAQTTLDAINGLIALQQSIPGGAPLIKLADLLQLQTGTSISGADLSLQVFQLAEAFVQLANKNSAVTASIPLNVPGIGTVTTRIKVIEPPQISAIGNPALAKVDPLGPNKIYVRTAQVRTLVSVDLNSSLTSLVGTLLNTVNSLLSPITNLLNGLLNLNLLSALSVGNVTDIQILPSPFRLDVNLDLAAGNAHVTDFSCGSAGSKSLTVPATTSAVDVRIGKMGTSAADAAAKVFASSSLPPVVAPIPLVDIGKKSCITALLCGARTPFYGGGIGLKTDTNPTGSQPAIGNSETKTFTSPAAANLPELYQPPKYQSIAATNIVNGLSNALSAPGIQMYRPAVSGSGLGSLLVGVGSTIDLLIPQLQQAVRTVLSPLLDPIVNSLLKNLGIELAQLDVGARMTCGGTARLVY